MILLPYWGIPLTRFSKTRVLLQAGEGWDWPGVGCASGVKRLRGWSNLFAGRKEKRFLATKRHKKLKNQQNQFALLVLLCGINLLRQATPHMIMLSRFLIATASVPLSKKLSLAPSSSGSNRRRPLKFNFVFVSISRTGTWNGSYGPISNSSSGKSLIKDA